MYWKDVGAKPLEFSYAGRPTKWLYTFYAVRGISCGLKKSWINKEDASIITKATFNSLQYNKEL